MDLHSFRVRGVDITGAQLFCVAYNMELTYLVPGKSFSQSYAEKQGPWKSRGLTHFTESDQS
jgi:hypothetical protein